MRTRFKLTVVRASELPNLVRQHRYVPEGEKCWVGALTWNGMRYLAKPGQRRRRWVLDIYVNLDIQMVTYYCRTRSLVVLNDLEYVEQLTIKEVDL